MNEWSLNFSKQVDYGRYDEITVEVALAAGDSLAAVDANSTPVAYSASFSRAMPDYSGWISNAGFPK